MSCHVINYYNGAKIMTPVNSFKDFARLRNSQRNRNMTRMARDGDVNAKRKMVQMNYSCLPNNGRLKGATQESDSVGMDVDFKAGMDKKEFDALFEATKKKILDKAEEIGLLMLERSATKGMHLVFRRHNEMSQEDNLKWASSLLGIEYDNGAKDITRVFFSPTAEPGDLFFCKDELFRNEMPGKQIITQPAQEDVKQPAQAEVKQPEDADVNIYGYDFTKIISKYWELYNNSEEPKVGNRNSLTFTLAHDLRTICDYDFDALKKVIPRYAGLPEKEYDSCLNNALQQPRKGISYRMQKVINVINGDKATASPNVDDIYSATPPPMPKELPWPMGQIASKAPDYYKPAVCENAFSAMTVNMSDVRFTYWDNVDHEPTIMSLLVAPMSVGKGCVNKPCLMLVEKVAQKDNIHREREAQWKLKNPAGASSIEPRPKDICIQVLIDNLTDAVFNQRVADANQNGGKYIYVKVDELDTLKNITSRNSCHEVSTIIRKAFDNSKHGQERVGSSSVTGIAPLRFNFNASCCPNIARNFFKRNITDGTITRLSLSTIIKPEGARPIYGSYDEAYRKTIDTIVDMLSSYHGNFTCQKANEFALHLCDENERLADLYDSEAYLVLSYRATVIAWLKGMILYLLNDQQWTNTIEEYVRWSLRYDLWNKMTVFGSMLEDEIAENRLAMRRGPQNLCDMLPDSFKLQDLENLRVKLGRKGGSAKNLLAKWKARGIVEYTSINGDIIKVKK